MNDNKNKIQVTEINQEQNEKATKLESEPCRRDKRYDEPFEDEGACDDDFID